MSMQGKGARLAAAAAIAAGAIASIGASSAHAAAIPSIGSLPGVTSVLLPDGSSCAEAYTDTTPFTQWGDSNEYRLVPGGDFSTQGNEWSLAGAATVSRGSEPYALSGASGNGELTLGNGGVATSPFSCVDATQPTVRFMADVPSGTQLSVSAIFQEPSGLDVTLPVGVIAGSSTWQPTPIMFNGEQIAGLLSGGAAPMALQMRVVGGTVAVDDVFVDPRMR